MTLRSMSGKNTSKTDHVSNSDRLEGGKRSEKPLPVDTPYPPLITIITVVYNASTELRATIESVFQQKRHDIEYIVVDGGSTDGTCDVLLSFNDKLDYWISEHDDGIYDAMNKGIKLSRGQFIYHLNVGDRLLNIPYIFNEAVSEDVSCIAGAVQISSNGLYVPSVGVALRFHNTLHHQGCFYRKTFNLRYDLRYRVFSDFDLNQRLLRGGCKIILCSDVVAYHDAGGISHTTGRFFEVYSIVRRNFGPLWVAVCFLYFKYRGLLRRLRPV